MAAEDPVLARRKAVVAICERAANGVIDRVVAEASRAADLFGLDAASASRYGEGIRSTMPQFFDAMAMADGDEREARIAALAGQVRAVSDQNHIPRIVERGLTTIAVRLARETIRRRAEEQSFTSDELDREFTAFGDKLEARLFGE
jgi:hypothetical protein